MTSPWPAPSREGVMCALCFGTFPLSALSLVDWPENPGLTDVCKPCRLLEVGLTVRAEHIYE